MLAKIQKWGDEQGIKIPKSLLKLGIYIQTKERSIFTLKKVITRSIAKE